MLFVRFCQRSLKGLFAHTACNLCAICAWGNLWTVSMLRYRLFSNSWSTVYVVCPTQSTPCRNTHYPASKELTMSNNRLILVIWIPIPGKWSRYWNKALLLKIYRRRPLQPYTQCRWTWTINCLAHLVPIQPILDQSILLMVWNQCLITNASQPSSTAQTHTESLTSWFIKFTCLHDFFQ